jgi:hypothetical protein
MSEQETALPKMRVIEETQSEKVRRALAALKRLIGSVHFRFNDEKHLQNALEVVFGREHVLFSREHRLSPDDRPDFFLPYSSIAVEVKISGAISKILRQLERYAQHDDVKGILLVTTRLQHQVPEELNGKPVMAATILGL